MNGAHKTTATDSFASGRRPRRGHPGGHRLRLLSYNIQTGIATTRYRHYVTHGWRHLLPHTERWTNLDGIVDAGLRDFDIVGLQEMDAGSLRTSFVNQARYLADRASFPFWHHQTNRRLGKIARHSNGLLSRLRPLKIVDYKLPGLPGRGALLTRFGRDSEWLALFVVHLSLGKRARMRQVRFLAQLVNEHPHAVVMGDFNCAAPSDEIRALVATTRLVLPEEKSLTFPSWRPQKRIDHILVSDALAIERSYVLPWAYSDHLPIALHIRVPDQIMV